MRRRELLAGLGGATVVGAGAWYALSRGGGERIDPVKIRTIDARGSDAGRMTVPVTGHPTVLDVFATWCAPCRTETRRLATVRDRLGGDVALVSVTNQAIGGTLSRADVADWFERNGGAWPVGVDDEGQLMAELSVSGLPTLAVVDAGGTITWSHTGLVQSADLLAAVRRLEG